MFILVGMKPSTLNALLLIGVLLIFGDCTVEKRLYNKGFHIEKRNRFRGEKDTENPLKTKDSNEKLPEKDSHESHRVVSDTLISSSQTPTDNVAPNETNEIDPEALRQEVKTVTIPSKETSAPEKPFTKAQKKKKATTYGLLTAGSGLIVGLLLLGFSHTYMGYATTISILVFGAFIFFILGLIFLGIFIYYLAKKPIVEEGGTTAPVSSEPKQEAQDDFHTPSNSDNFSDSDDVWNASAYSNATSSVQEQAPEKAPQQRKKAYGFLVGTLALFSLIAAIICFLALMNVGGMTIFGAVSLIFGILFFAVLTIIFLLVLLGIVTYKTADERSATKPEPASEQTEAMTEEEEAKKAVNKKKGLIAVSVVFAAVIGFIVASSSKK